MSRERIIRDIDSYISESNKKGYSKLYIWITNNIERRLFVEHNVPRKGHRFIYCKADSEIIARSVENYYLNKWMKWWDWWGNGDWSAKYVYCYEIKSYTNP